MPETVEEYRRRIADSDIAVRRERAFLPFEQKLEIVRKLQKTAMNFKNLKSRKEELM